MLLDDKRRRGDIGKQDALRKSQLKYIEHITTVMNNDAETPESSKDTRLGTFLSGQGLLKADTSDTQQIPMNSRIIKIPCQPTLPVNNPPMTGAATGATPLIAPITASILASSFPENLSVATEREITIPPAPATPCISRKVTNE